MSARFFGLGIGVVIITLVWMLAILLSILMSRPKSVLVKFIVKTENNFNNLIIKFRIFKIKISQIKYNFRDGSMGPIILAIIITGVLVLLPRKDNESNQTSTEEQMNQVT